MVDQQYAVVCVADSMLREAISATLDDVEGFILTAAVGSAPDALRVMETDRVDLLVLDNALPGRSGLDWMPEVLDALPLGAVLMVASGPADREPALRAGAFGVVYRTQLNELSGALGRALAWLSDESLRQPGERRTGRDRRQHQDWTKVTSERRVERDRRADD